MRDLFQSDDGGWLQDVGLLDRLVAEKLKAAADDDRRRGLEMGRGRDQPALRRDPRLAGDCRDGGRITETEQAARDALQAEYDRLSEEYEDANELPDAVDQRLGEIEMALEELDNRPVRYDPAEIAIAGVFVTLDADGKLKIDRGYVRPEDEAPVEPVAVEDADTGSATGTSGETARTAIQRAVVTIGGQSAPTMEEDEEDGIKPLPERLITELTAHRTLALRDALANHPHVAMTALLHKLVSDTFLHRPATGALEASVRQIHFTAQAEDLKDSRVRKIRQRAA